MRDESVKLAASPNPTAQLHIKQNTTKTTQQEAQKKNHIRNLPTHHRKKKSEKTKKQQTKLQEKKVSE